MNYLGNDSLDLILTNKELIHEVREIGTLGKKEFTGLKFHDSPRDGDRILTLLDI